MNIALGTASGHDACPRFDGDADGAVSASTSCSPPSTALLNPVRDADESLLYTSLTYSDPPVARFDPPLHLGGAASTTRRGR